MEDNKRKLYDALSDEFDLGTYEEFERNIGDSVKRQKLYDAASADYDLGDFESYSQKIGPTHRESLEAFTAEHGSFLNDFEARDSAEIKESRAGMSSGIYIPSKGSITGEERQRYLELHKQEEALKKAWFTSDEYLAQKDADALLLSNIRKNINRESVAFAQANPVLKQEGAFQANPYATRGAEADTELEKYMTASRIMDDAIKMHNAPSRYDGKNVFLKFGKGAGDVLSDAEFWTAGLSEIADNFGVRSVLKNVQDKLGNLNDLSEESIENILSPAEKAVLQAWAINAQEQLKRKDDLSRAYQAGQGATESLGFMAEFALTGGVGQLASEGVESMAKWLGKKAMTTVGGMADDVAEKVLKETGEKIARSTAGKYGTRLAESLAEAAGRTGVMPSTFRNISEKATEIETDEEGNNYLVGMNNAFAKGFADSFIENLSEGGRVNALGELIGDVAGKVPAYKRMVDKFSKTKASELLDAFNSSGIMNTLRAGGWHGLGEEYLEEWYGNTLRTLTGVDKEALKEFATVDNQIVTLTSFLPMTIFGGTVGTAQVLSASRDLEKKSAALKSALLERGYDEAQADNMIDMMRGSTPAEVSEFLSPIVNSVAGRSVDEAAALMKPVGEFAAAVRKWQAFDTKYRYQEQEQRDNLRAQMEETLGQFWQEDENGRQTVQRGVNASGESVYLLGKPSADEAEAGVSAEVAAVTSDGRKVFVNPSEYELDDELELNEFLGTEIMAEKGNREKARMVEERDAQNAAIREAAVPGTAINIGTEEAPVQAVVIQRNPDGVIVNTPDGQTRQMTLEEFGNYVGINAVPMTDAQIEEQEAAALSADRAQREAELDQEYSDEDSAYEEIAEAEDEIEQATEAAEVLPLKADGSVDQTALWNRDPERWAAWNDEQRQDGGVNSLAYINGAIAKESARIAEMQAGYDAISDFDERDAVEREVVAVRERLQRLVDLRDGYVARAEAAQVAAEEVAAEQVAPRMSSQMSEEEKAQIDTQYENILRQTRTKTERVRLLQEYVNKISEESMPAVVITKDNFKEAMRAAGCSEALITRVEFFVKAGQNIGAFIANGHIFLMEDGLPSMEEARISYVHERQHAFNSSRPEFVQKVVDAVNGNRSILLGWLSTFMDAKSLETYKDDNAFRLADEVIARCMEIAYTTEEFSVDLQSRGIPSEVISTITEIDNEQRFTQSYLNARRGTRRTSYDNVSGLGNMPEDGRNLEQVSGGILEQQETRSSSTGDGRARAGQAGAEVISEEQLDAPNSGEPQQITTEDGEVIADTNGKGGVRFSIRTWLEGGRNYLAAWLDKDETLTAEEKADILARMDEFYENAQKYTDTYVPFGKWSEAAVRYDSNGNPLMSVIKANGDYAMNLDFSLVCKKRRPLNRLLRTLINRNAFGTYSLKEREIAEINWILQEHGFEVACALCFIDSKRYRVSGVADVFAALYNKMVKSLAPQGVPIAHFNYNNNPNVEVVENGIDTLADDQLNWDNFEKYARRFKPTSVEGKVAQFLRDNPSQRRLVDATDFIEAEGFEAVKANNQELLKLYNAKKGTGGPKASFGDVQYLNDILKKEKKFDVDKAYSVGGVRIQSFSNFVPHMYFDYMQLFAELAAKKLPAHAYTKEVLFAKIFGLTGVKINLSLVPAVVEGGVAPGLDADGNYAWADAVRDPEGNVIQQAQSFPFDEAMNIQNAPGYSRNCGAIAVGISDEHIEKMLDDPNIQFIIPYHKSSLNAIVARMTNIDQYKDYTNVQTTKKASGTKLDKDTADFNFNEYLHNLGENGTPQQAAQAYLDWCRENNFRPKFSQFAYHPNYYKLLVDFNTIDTTTGEYAPQGAVTMSFPTEQSAFGNVEALIEQGLGEDMQLEEKMEAEVDEIADEVEARLEEISKEPKLSEKQQLKKMAELADERAAQIKAKSEGVIDLVEEARKAQAKHDAKAKKGKKSEVSFRITPEMDKAYMDAVQAGDMETAQRMVDEAAEAAGYTIRGDHGRVSKFTIFDRNKANPEGDWGQGFYFSNNEEDVENNYATVEGPDLEAKIEREVERRVNLAEMNGEFNEDGEVDEFAIREEVENEFITSEPNVVHAAIKMNNPFVVGHGMVEIGEDGLGQYDMQETYLTAEYETDEDGEADYSVDPTGTLVDLIEALNEELSEYEWVNVDAYDILANNLDGMTAGQFEKEAREFLSPYIDNLVNDNGEIMSNEIIRAAIERAGFDGIVDNTVNQKFGTARRYGQSMEGMDSDTRHYIAFQSSQIKETDPVTYDDNGNVIPLSERFNPENADIRFRVRGENESAMDFHQGMVDDFLAKYNPNTDLLVFPVNEETAKRFGYTLEELNDVNGIYVPDEDIIAIFAHEDETDGDEVENTLFHESIHKLATFYPYMRQAGKWMLDNADQDGVLSDYKAVIDDDYSNFTAEEQQEEMLTHVLSGAMSMGQIDMLFRYLPESERDICEQILNEIGYDRERESRERVGRSYQESEMAEADSVSETSGESESEAQEADSEGLSFRVTDITPEVQDELDAIKASAIVMGNFMKAPNGQPTNLTEEQWALVRTKAFKAWFGDWEKAARIQKLRNSQPVIMNGNEHEGKYDLNRDSAQRYILDKLRDTYTIADTNERIKIVKKGAKKVTSHSMGNDAHVRSIAIIPELIRSAIFITEMPADKADAQYDSYRYYVCGLEYAGESYTVKMTVGVKNGDYYYDHTLTDIEKGKLLDMIESQQGVGREGFTPTGNESDPSYALSDIKDKKLISILQTNSSKVVDENGEPKVVYHGSPNEFTAFDRDMIGETTDPGFYGQGFYFAVTQREARGYGENVINAFINLKNPIDLNEVYAQSDKWDGEYAEGAVKWWYGLASMFPEQTGEVTYSSIERGDWTILDLKNRIDELALTSETPFADAIEEFEIDEYFFDMLDESDINLPEEFTYALMAKGYDGVINAGAVNNEIVAFYPNQIKSATDNTGEFSEEDGDIRYRISSDSETGIESLVERTFRTSGAFSFSGKEKIESRDDVAFIFKQLEDSAIENSFLVFVKDGIPTIIHVGMGDVSSTMIDNSVVLPAYKDFGADEIYMVHNHPSGSLYASKADLDSLSTISMQIPDVPVEGIIINTVSGEYASFDLTDSNQSLIPDDGGTVPVKVLSFDKNVFAPDYKSKINERRIKGSGDVASFLSAHRLGEGTKVGALLLNRQNMIYGNLVTNDNEVSVKNAETLARQIAEAANRTGSSSVILFGDFDYSDRALRSLSKEIKKASGNSISLLDVVRLEGNHTLSLADDTLPSRSTLSDGISFRVNENPTEAQKEAGNYKKGHLNLDGYRITIENPKGSVRRGTDSKGNAWENTLNNDYGYIRGTEGVDGDHIDVYLSDNPTEGNVFVIDQVNPQTREFDEHKVMYGFNSAEEAREAYLANFSEGWDGLGTITEVTKDEFKKWIQSSHRKTKPFSEYKSIRAIGAQSEGEEVEDDLLPVTGTPTEDVVAEGVSLSPAQLASLAGDIFAALPEDSRKKITDGLNGNILGLQDAILQIPTSLATKENWNDEDRQVAEVVAEQMTKAAGKEMTRPFSASEALWTLYNAVNKATDLVSEASRALVRRNLGFDSQTLEMEQDAKDGVRFRTVGDASANAQASMYNRGAANVWTRLKESFVDMNASVEELVKAIEKRSGKTAQGFENILMALNQQSSKGLAAMEAYEQKFLNKMFDEIRKIMDKTDFRYEDIVRYVILKHGLERNTKLAQRDAKAHYQEIYDDIIAKIKGMNKAQKRTYLTNAQLRDADAKAELASLQAVNTSILTDEQKRDHKKELAKAKKEAAEAAEHLVRAQKIATMTEQDALNELDKIFKKIEKGTDSVYKEMRKNDYSGISSMFYDTLGVNRKDYATEEEYQAALMQAKTDRYDTLDDIEVVAQMEVTLFENEVNTDNLWKSINAATKETLRQQYEANMISKDQYDNLRNMFEFYVPLRGFKDNTAEDMYTYYRRPNSTGYTKPILGAEGRKTEAESPFGWIAAMAGSAIASNVKNEAKLALYYFVSNRPDNGIATVSKTWFVHTPGDVDANGKRIFRPAYPTFDKDLSTDDAKQAYEDWQEQMRELQKQGLAYEAGQRLNLGNSVVNISDTNKPEHIVTVKVGGKDYTIVINGNPRAAQAINGDINIEATAQDYSSLFGPILRWMSSVNTSYNPEFWITNLMRDVAFTMMAVNIKGDAAYRRKFYKNYLKAFKVISLVAKNEKGTIGDSYIEQQYKDFVKYGGVTGYTQIKDSETWEKEIENYLTSNDPDSIRSGKVMRGMKSAFHGLHRFGESLEQVSRFAAFLTARETGKSVNEAVNDAKEITVNFNRKGSGKMITLEEAKYLTDRNGQPLNKLEQWMAVGLSSIAPLGRRFIMFFNAAIQGLNATYKLYAKDKTKAIGWALGYAAVGMMNAVLHAMLDDDDDYLDIPRYERRTSLMIGGNGAYFKWALPQEARAFYALGDLAVESVMGRYPQKLLEKGGLIGQTLSIVSDVLPINPSEGWKAFMPSVAVPAFELALNEDYTGSPIYNEQKWLTEEEKRRSARWSKAYSGTGDPYIGIARVLNAATGGDEHDAGWINIQPEKMEHIVLSAFGGTIRTADKFINTIMAAIDPEEDVTVRQFPFLNRFLTINDERYRNVHVNDVYDYYSAEAEHTIRLEKQYTKDRNADALKDLRSSDEYKWATVYSRYKKPIKKYQEAIRAADTTNERMELMKQQDELKRKMIKEISEL